MASRNGHNFIHKESTPDYCIQYVGQNVSERGYNNDSSIQKEKLNKLKAVYDQSIFNNNSYLHEKLSRTEDNNEVLLQQCRLTRHHKKSRQSIRRNSMDSEKENDLNVVNIKRTKKKQSKSRRSEKRSVSQKKKKACV